MKDFGTFLALKKCTKCHQMAYFKLDKIINCYSSVVNIMCILPQ